MRVDCGLRTARTTDRIGCFQACRSSARTSKVPVRAPYGTHTVHLQDLASMWLMAKTPGRPLTASMHLTTPSQEEDFVWTSHGVQVCTAFQASLTTEVLRHIAPCAEDRSMNYITNFVIEPNILEF